MCVIKIGTMTELNGYLDYNGLIVSIQPYSNTTPSQVFTGDTEYFTIFC